MIIKDITKVGMIIGLIGIIIVALVFRRFDYVLAFIAGFLASNLSLAINVRSLDLSGSKRSFFNNVTSFIIRLVVYAIVLVLTFKIIDVNAMLIAFVGCLTIRVSILIYGIKGGIVDGHFK